MKATLECQSRKICLVIRKNKSIPLSKIQSYCEQEFEQYAFIEHKEDIHPVTKLVEPTHYHIVGNAKGSRIAFSTRLNTIVKFFKFENADGIEIDRYNSFVACLQYLCHINQKEKTPHDWKEIIHNLPAEEFQLYINADSGQVVTYDFLYVTILHARNILDVIKALGLKNYKDNRNTIWDMWKCIRALSRGMDDDTIM